MSSSFALCVQKTRYHQPCLQISSLHQAWLTHTRPSSCLWRHTRTRPLPVSLILVGFLQHPSQHPRLLAEYAVPQQSRSAGATPASYTEILRRPATPGCNVLPSRLPISLPVRLPILIPLVIDIGAVARVGAEPAVAAVVGVEVAVLVLGAVELPAVVHSLAAFEGGKGEGGGEGEEEGAGGWLQLFQFFFLEREGVEGCEVVDWGEDWGWESI